MKEKKAVKVKNQTTCILENDYQLISIDREKDAQLFCITPLISCFAFVLLYQNQKKHECAILYHAKSGYPDRLSEIYAVMSSDFLNLKKVIIVTPYSLSYGNTNQLIELGKNEIRHIFNCYHDDYEIVEDCSRYFVNTIGKFGLDALIEIPRDHEEHLHLPSTSALCRLI